MYLCASLARQSTGLYFRAAVGLADSRMAAARLDPYRRGLPNRAPPSAGWRRIAARNSLNNSYGYCEASFNLAASCRWVAEERCHPAPQHTVCRAGAALL
jgi:hypothetical protein